MTTIIKRVIACGELPPVLSDTDELLYYAGRKLDKACVYDILGNVYFEGEDGKLYTVTVEAVISETDAESVQEWRELNQEDEL